MSGLGIGIGWRPALALTIDRYPNLGFVELLAENLEPRAPVAPAVNALIKRGVQVVIHGVSLSLGSAEGFSERALDRLARLADRHRAAWISEHVECVRAGGWEAGHLLPVPRQREMLEILAENAYRARRRLPAPLALENIAAPLSWPEQEMSEPAFLSALLRESGTHLLLDVANLYANALNHRFDATGWLDQAPLERLAYVHAAGGTRRGAIYHDTHAHP